MNCEKCGTKLIVLSSEHGIVAFCPKCVPDVETAFMNPLSEGNKNLHFELIYRKTVRANYDILVNDWDKHGGKWISEMTGQTCCDFEDCNMSEYHRFDELSGEEQYAFFKWLERQKPQERF